ncbi:MAG: RdgB/HAM1 family non-canonical purine NTP pyrophosphatase [Paracoccaceae bacterium]
MTAPPRLAAGETLVVASHNAGKVREIAELVAPFGLETRSAANLGLPEPEETETTFEGNARLKAHAAARSAQLPALADDSGLAVAALDGAPGVYSARWAETPSGRDFNVAMERVQEALDQGEVPAPRRASFVCALCLAWPDGREAVVSGRVEGSLVWPPRGDRGFGYDPMFLPEHRSETFGEMAPEQKHRISHRAAAFRQLIAKCFGPGR